MAMSKTGKILLIGGGIVLALFLVVIIGIALIAESMGKRGSAQDALAWINNEIPPEQRSQLYRRVSNGVVSAIVNNRTNREMPSK